jgi:undecaprenyl-diphosphatase
MSFVRRYDEDTSAPTLRRARRDLLHRTVVPAVGLWAIIVGLGLTIVGPLHPIEGEAELSERLVVGRTPTMDAVTAVWSNIGATFFIIGACLLVVGLVWWRTRQWWVAVVPAIAIAVQSSVFVTAAAVVGRTRPEVEHLDVSPPTSSFPSGHVGASTAFYLTLALLSRRIRNPVLRWTVTLICLLIPVLVAYSRMYRGMHHASDVVVGAMNGAVCAVLAWRYLRRGSEPAVAGPSEGVATERREPDGGEGEQDGAGGHVGNGSQGAVQPAGLVGVGGHRGGDQEAADQHEGDSLGHVPDPSRPLRPPPGVLDEV